MLSRIRRWYRLANDIVEVIFLGLFLLFIGLGVRWIEALSGNQREEQP